MKEKISLETQISSIWNHIKGFHIIHFIYTGNELGLFSIISNFGKSGISSVSLAKEKSLDPDYIDKWCNCGIAWGILDDVDSSKIRLAPHMDAILTMQGDPRYLLPYIKSCIDHFGPDMKNHSDFYKSGKIYKFQDHSYDFSSDIGNITEGLQTLVVHKILPDIESINKTLKKGGNLLDFGCGTAKLLIKASKYFPNSKFFGLDIDKSGLDIGNKHIKSLNLENKIKLINTNEKNLPEPKSIDVVTMVEVFHEISVSERQNVLKMISKLLKKDGYLIIFDETMPERKNLKDPSSTLSVLTQFNEMTWGNVVPKAKDQEDLLKKFNLSKPDRKLIGGLFTLLVSKCLQ